MSDLRSSLLRPWRLRFLIFALGLFILALIIGALFWREIALDQRGVVLAMGGMFLLAVMGWLYWFYYHLGTNLLKPLLALERELEAHNHSGAPVKSENYKETWIASLASELACEAVDLRPKDETSENWLSELLHVLDQGLIVASMDHQILLINARAREMFGQNRSLALGRDLSRLLDTDTINYAIERQSAEDAVGAERLFCRFVADEQIMPARFSILHDQQGNKLGYVLAFHDATNTLFRMQELSHSFDELLCDARAFAGEIDLLEMAGLELEEAKARFQNSLTRYKRLGQAHLGQAWPKGRMTLRNLFRVIEAQTNDVKFDEVPEQVFLRCDGAAIVSVVEHLLGTLQKKGHKLSVAALMEETEVKIEISSSQNARIAIADVEAAMRQALTRLPTAPTGDEILRAHGTEIWPHIEDDRSNLVFVLQRIPAALPVDAARPEYYDFEARIATAKMDDVRLRDLAIVVFDSETTGLDPRAGDEMVQLSAVRVRSGKLIRAEYFDELVHPGRKIPAASTKIHGITDAMVKNAPGAQAVVHDFHDYCHGEVLLAHNAAFDMAFLRKDAMKAGVQFDQAVLDTVFMSAFLFDYSGKHTLDDLAARFDVRIPEEKRHTALGDALATAEVFVKMLPLLEVRGVETLGQMLEIGQQMRAIRRQQSRYGLS